MTLTATASNDLTSRQVAVLYAAEVHGDFTHRPTRGEAAGFDPRFAAARKDGRWTAEWDGLKVIIRYVGGGLYDVVFERRS